MGLLVYLHIHPLFPAYIFFNSKQPTPQTFPVLNKHLLNPFMNEPIDSKSSLQTMKKYYSSLAEMVRNLPKVKELDEAWVVTAKY